MSNLSENLSRHEFACECNCGFDTVDIELVDVLQDVVDYFEVRTAHAISIKITGPNRCVKHNADVGGADDSQHIYARASDFKLFKKGTGIQIDPKAVADYLESKYPNKYGIGRYYNRTHLDTRTNGPARWSVKK